LYGSEGSWADLFRRSRELKLQPTISGALSSLAIVAPLYVIASGLLANTQAILMTAQLLAAAGTSLLLFIIVPLTMARLQGVEVQGGFQLRRASPVAIAAAIILGCTLWPLAYDSIILCQSLGIATLSAEKLAEHRPALLTMIERMRAVPSWIVLLSLAVAPAIGEEFFFRGYLLGSLRRRLPAWAAIILTGAVFGLFHASVGGLIAVERIVSSTFLGFILGWVCWRTGSVFPGILLHVLHNGLMLSLIYFGARLQQWGWDIEGERYLPPPLVAATTVLVAGAMVVIAGTRNRHRSVDSAIPPISTGTELPAPEHEIISN
jgi:ABC-2 type transport system permease protein/sodium transport system permease protein